MRIQKVLAHMGYASRRKVEDLIKNKKIKINGRIAQLGDKLSGTEKLEIDNEVIKYKMPSKDYSKLILLNKPLGYLCSHSSDGKHPIIYDLLPKLAKGKWMSIGRLDLNSQGLLLVTNNGDLLQRLLHPKQALKRTYRVRIHGELKSDNVREMQKGIKINNNLCKFSKIELVKKGTSNSQWKVSLYEGRNREVREMFSHFNCQVNYLKRVEYGPFNLPADLQPGQWFDIPIDVLEAKL